jgi:alkylation response protein AidB-like acyl-CoA dehydrogenase
MTPRSRFRDELLALPLFEEPHRSLAADAERWAAETFGAPREGEPPEHEETRAAIDARCREIHGQLAAAGLTRYCVRREFGGELEDFDARAICLIRETLAYHDGLADFVFAMQGLGSGAISIAGSPELKARYLPRVARGESIAAFALSEPDAGSDVAALTCRAQAHGAEYVLDGTKTWISNGGIADFYCVFARTEIGEVRADGSTRASGISAFGSGIYRRPAHRPQCAASARGAQVRALPDTRRSPHRRRGRGVQDGHAHPGCIPLLGRRRGNRLRAPRLRRGGGARAQAAHVR